MTIPLIDKQDGFEIVDFKIAEILAAETVLQQALATSEGKPDPSLWEFDVFLEASNPIAVFQNDPEAEPIVNVWFDDDNFSMKDGSVVKNQIGEAKYNVDIYVSTPSSDNVAGGYNKGDVSSSKDLFRIIRLVRNILMHPDYTYLNLQGLVGRRRLQSIQTFQPQINDRPVQNVVASRLNFQVRIKEEPVLESFEPLELIFTTAKRVGDNKVIFESVNYPTAPIFKITVNDGDLWTSGGPDTTSGQQEIPS